MNIIKGWEIILMTLNKAEFEVPECGLSEEKILKEVVNKLGERTPWGIPVCMKKFQRDLDYCCKRDLVEKIRELFIITEKGKDELFENAGDAIIFIAENYSYFPFNTCKN